jgi:hypothetical protein
MNPFQVLQRLVVMMLMCGPHLSSVQILVAGQNEDESSSSVTACEAESAALNTNTELSDAATALLTTTKDEIIADFSNFCTLIGRQCTVDLSEYSADFEAACAANQGQFYPQTYKLACTTDTVSPIEIPGTVTLNNIPGCLGASCDITNLPSSITQIQEDLATQMNTDVNAALGDSVICSVSSTGETTPSSSSRPYIHTLMGQPLLLLLLLLLVSFWIMADNNTY